MPTSKQINYIVWLFEGTLPELFSKIPKNNERYPNVKADYRRIILADKIKNLSHSYSQTLIDLINKQDEEAVTQFIYGLQGINN